MIIFIASALTETYCCLVSRCDVTEKSKTNRSVARIRDCCTAELRAGKLRDNKINISPPRPRIRWS